MPSQKKGRPYRIPPELYGEIKEMIDLESVSDAKWNSVIHKFALLFHKQSPNKEKQFVIPSRSTIHRLEKKIEVVDSKTDWTTEARDLACVDLHTYTKGTLSKTWNFFQ